MFLVDLYVQHFSDFFPALKKSVTALQNFMSVNLPGNKGPGGPFIADCRGAVKFAVYCLNFQLMPQTSLSSPSATQ